MSLRDQFDKLSPREQKLITVFGIVLALFVVLGIPIYVYGQVSSAGETNDKIRKLLTDIDKAKELLAKRKHQRDALAMRYARPAPALGPFIEKAAKEFELTVPDTKNKPEVKHGKAYMERITVVRMRKISMLPLVKTLEKIENSGYPVAITRLKIKKRTGGPDIFDVELGVSAYDKVGGSKKSKEKDKKEKPSDIKGRPKKGKG